MKLGTKKHPAVGARVEIPAYCDLWMRGARFGVVERAALGSKSGLAAGDARFADVFVVRMDNPQVKRPVRVIADDCRFV